MLLKSRVFLGLVVLCSAVMSPIVGYGKDGEDTGFKDALVFEVKGEKALVEKFFKIYTAQFSGDKLGPIAKYCHFSNDMAKYVGSNFVFACLVTPYSFYESGSIFISATEGITEKDRLTMATTYVPCNKRTCPSDPGQGCTLYLWQGGYRCFHTGKLGQNGHECFP